MEIQKKKYITINDLEVYILSRRLSKIGWEIYEPLDWQTKKIMGDQFIESTDSCGANIAEGYGRFHYLDKIKFYYIARASLMECNTHWLELMCERNKIQENHYNGFKSVAKDLAVKLNNFIAITFKSRLDKKQ